MKNKMQIIMLVILAVVLVSSGSAKAEDCQDRSPVINFQGALGDDDGLAYDGTANMEVAFSDAAQIIYQESFDNVEVERGRFRLPLLQGTVISGSSSAVLDNTVDEVYVDLSVDGALVLDHHPMGMHLASVRAERADYAYAIKDGFKLASGQIPEHSAIKVTSGTLDLDRLPQIPVEKFNTGTLSHDQIPQIEPNKVTTGVFGEHLLPNALSAEIFTSGQLINSVLPQDIILRDNIYVGAGAAGHLGVVPVPVGFTRNHCQWVVGIRDIDADGGIDQFRVYTDADGVISCRWSAYQADAELNNYCMASYFVVCLK